MHRAKHRLIAGSTGRRTLAKHHRIAMPALFQSIDALTQCATEQGYILDNDPVLLDLKVHLVAFIKARGADLDKSLLAAQVSLSLSLSQSNSKP